MNFNHTPTNNRCHCSSGDAKDHLLNEGMHGWTFAGYNLVLAGLFAFVSDWWNLIAVGDQMLQEILRGARGSATSRGYDAYADHHPKLADLARWWDKWRLVVTRVYLVVGWVTVPTLMILYFNANIAIVEEQRSGVVLGGGWFWASWNDEFTRMFVAMSVASLNMVIVCQDWYVCILTPPSCVFKCLLLNPPLIF